MKILPFKERRRRLAARGSLAALLAVIGPGLLAGLSDDDPAGITTYSVLGARTGYQLLWVLAVSTAALIVFHDVGARMGVVTGRGLTALVRRRYGKRVTWSLLVTLLVANIGTTAAEFAGIAAAADLANLPRTPCIVAAVVLVSVLLLSGSFTRVEHVLIAMGSVFLAYVAAAILAHPDWGAAARGMVVPSVPKSKDGVVLMVATIGTTLAPWGLTFIQSYAADKHLVVRQLRAERFDVVTGAVLTGVIGAFIVIASAATLHPAGVHVDDAAQAARSLEPVAGGAAEMLFGLGLVGASLLAAAVLPLATAYSVCEAAGRPAHLGRGRESRLFRAVLVGSLVIGGTLVCVPGVPLISLLVLTQALNAILLVPVLVVIRRLALSHDVMGEYTLSTTDRWATLITLIGLTAAVATLLLLPLF
ncbi:MAG: Nramp family divalent metal transporter [Solirubrobacterales bacterium]